MFELKEMPFQEKYDSILGYSRLVEDFAQKLAKELGELRSSELQSLWKQGTETIPEDASDRDRYEIAYRNFMWTWVSANKFMESHQGEAGTKRYMQAAISACKKKYSLEAFPLKIVESISRKTAFKILAKRLAYELQAFSSYMVTELNENRMVLNVAPCKILMDKNGNNFCSMACQNIIPSWLEAQFDVKMDHKRQEQNCSIVFEHF